MNFRLAIEALKDGKMVSRQQWDRKFIFVQVPATISKDVIPKMTSLPEAVKSEFTKRGGSIYYMNQIAVVNADNIIQAWNPTIAELLAVDWVEIE